MRNMRFIKTAVNGLLTRHQRLYVQKASSLIVKESSDLASASDSDTDSENDQNTVTFDAFQRSLKAMVKSKNKTDKRFINLHRVS